MRRSSFVLTASAAAVSASSKPARVLSQTRETITVAGPPTDAFAPLYYGIKTGAFERAGIDLQLVPTSSGGAALTAVIGGSYTLANTSLPAAMQAHLRSIPVVLVAPQAVYTPQNPFFLLLTAADSPYKTGADLNGKIISVSALNDLNQAMTSAWVDKTGGDSRTLKFVEIPVPATGEAIAQHRVDAGIALEPFLDMSLATGKTRVLADAMAAIGSRIMFGAYVGRQDWADAHADLARTFVRVAGEVATYTNAHPEATVELMSEVTKIPLNIMQKMKRVLCATTLDPRLIQPLIDVAARYHVIDRAFPARDFFWNPQAKS